MPPKPTCKVVKREGQRGARIDPKGCKVRTTKDAQGNKKKETKQGNENIKRTTTKRDMRLAVAGSPQRPRHSRHHSIRRSDRCKLDYYLAELDPFPTSLDLVVAEKTSSGMSTELPPPTTILSPSATT